VTILHEKHWLAPHYLVGRWTPDPAFDAIIASQRQIDLGEVELGVALDTNQLTHLG